MERVSDEWLARRIVAFDEMRCGDSELHVSPRYAQAMLDALLELQSRRAAEREQAAPEPRKPAKWERRLAKMGATLRKLDDGRWECCVSGSPDQYVGDRPADAVKAAWRAWKEAQK